MNAVLRRLLLFLLLLAGIDSRPALAQDSSSPPTLIRSGRLFDSARGILLPAGDILVRGRRWHLVPNHITPIPSCTGRP